MGMKYFFDSYAIIELLEKAPNFYKYIDQTLIFTVLNVIEVTQFFLSKFGEAKAKEVCSQISKFAVEILDEDILRAVTFREEHKKKSLSYADCLGYTFAKSHNLIFLTGDDAFKDMTNVEFVK